MLSLWHFSLAIYAKNCDLCAHVYGCINKFGPTKKYLPFSHFDNLEKDQRIQIFYPKALFVKLLLNRFVTIALSCSLLIVYSFYVHHCSSDD